MKKVLAVETSCDDTCTALVREDGFVEQSYRQNQIDIHQPFGGVVPERASRNHSRYLLPLIHKILQTQDMRDIDLLSYTHRPGLLGSLLTGAVTVKTLSVIYEKPFIGINHIEGHILSPFLHSQKHKQNKHWGFPYIALVVSGGHSHLFIAENFGKYKLIGQTLDDAAGEAFDKFARMLDLPYPGGVYVDRLSKNGDLKYKFPVALAQKGNLNFSFSGLKTSAVLMLEKMTKDQIQKEKSSLCASYQTALVNQIIFKLEQCLNQYPSFQRAAVVGGVSANSQLRERCFQWAQEKSVDMMVPPLEYCTDNAGMIGFSALQRFLRGETSSLDLPCYAENTSWL